tara:strand:- start:2847 stop:4106 length:1260 start_codon:yes stop_codon:yes gene_type:complete
MIKWMEDMFPFHRSLTGKGNIKTLNYLKKINNELKIKYFKSGKKVFDWKIPDVWEISEAYFLDKNGKKYADLKKNNLHVVQYSKPINKTVTKKELLKNLFTLPKLPNLIPYVTSYYNKTWGFCIQDKVKKELPTGKYKVVINSKFTKGKMHYGEIYLRGKIKKEIFFSTYICHPSMANNELSGPVLSSALASYIKKTYRKNLFSYRFVFAPETIGAIAYINKNLKNLKKDVIAGFNISCVGDNGDFSHISSRQENTLADKAIKAAFLGRDKKKFYSFLERGSDERQYCYPGVDLPFCGFSRTKYGKFKFYHTSGDDLNYVSQKGLDGSFQIFKEIIDSFESNLFPKNKYICEPKMDKRNLYPKINFIQNDKKNKTKDMMNLLAYCDGYHSIFDIAIKCNLNLSFVSSQLMILKKEQLIK